MWALRWSMEWLLNKFFAFTFQDQNVKFEANRNLKTEIYTGLHSGGSSKDQKDQWAPKFLRNDPQFYSEILKWSFKIYEPIKMILSFP